MRTKVEDLRKHLPSAEQIVSDLFGVEWRDARCPRSATHQMIREIRTAFMNAV
jgi:hypothetical protein